jgi:hypothetical protein
MQTFEPEPIPLATAVVTPFHGSAHLTLSVFSPHTRTNSQPYQTKPKQAELDNGEAVKALRRFNDNLRALPADKWGEWWLLVAREPPAWAAGPSCSCAAWWTLLCCCCCCCCCCRLAGLTIWLNPQSSVPQNTLPPKQIIETESALRPVFNELCFNLESFNPAFAACVLMVRRRGGDSCGDKC